MTSTNECLIAAVHSQGPRPWSICGQAIGIDFYGVSSTQDEVSLTTRALQPEIKEGKCNTTAVVGEAVLVVWRKALETRHQVPQSHCTSQP
jgi:hypothetical protein